MVEIDGRNLDDVADLWQTVKELLNRRSMMIVNNIVAAITRIRSR